MSHKHTDGDSHNEGGCCGGQGHAHDHSHEDGGCCGGHGHNEGGCCGGHGHGHGHGHDHSHDHSHDEGGCCGGHGQAAGHQPPGLENAGVLDAFAHDKSRDVLVMAMYELRPWDGGDVQLLQLQEKLNAYLSFALDGELAENFPQLAGKPVEIQLRTTSEPGPQVWDLIRRVREQLAFQDIAFEVIALEEETSGECGCHH